MRRGGTKENTGEAEATSSHVSEFLKSSAHPKMHFSKIFLTSRVDKSQTNRSSFKLPTCKYSTPPPTEMFLLESFQVFLFPAGKQV